MKTLVIVPTIRERDAIRFPGVEVAAAGAEAEAATTALIAKHLPEVVIIAGIAGGLDPSLHAGSVVVCRGAMTTKQPEIRADEAAVGVIRAALRASEEVTPFGFATSRALTVNRPIAGRALKTRLWNEHGTAAVDMETYWMAHACEAAGVPWVGVRVVLDTAQTDLPRSLRTWQADGDERGSMRRALVRPFEWPAYGRLALQHRKARKALEEAVACASEGLARVDSLAAAKAGMDRARASVPLTLVNERPA